MKNELISMVDFVFYQDKYREISRESSYELIVDYAYFLNTPLNISMFVPAIKVGDKWVVLYKLPNHKKWLNNPKERMGFNNQEHEQYQTAQDNVIFEGFEYDGKFISHNQVSYLIDRLHYNTIQDLIKYKPTLTKYGLEVSGLNR